MTTKRLFGTTRQYILAGVLTVIPMWVTWLVFRFILSSLERLGGPFAQGLAGVLGDPGTYPASLLHAPWLQSLVAVLSTLAVFYMIGWIATRVVGHRILAGIDALVARIPLAQTIYGSTKKLLSALQNKPEGVERVVLVEFPIAGMKAVGLVTRTFQDACTGRELAAVFVPTTPNPTSGYLEIVPVDQLVSTDWTIDDAMSFVMSGGAVAPRTIAYSGRDPHALAGATRATTTR
jgi:uncharacterized membrane protein